MQTSIVVKKFNILRGNEAGMSLISTLLALVILGLVSVGFLIGLMIAFKAVTVSQERVAAESLANSQLEYIRSQDYIAVAEYDPGDPDKRYDIIDIPIDLVSSGYDIELSSPVIIVVPDAADEVQSISVVIRRNGEETLTISDYKVGGLS
ncbi:hypothetical protein ACFLVS_00300 [Chloroflexota bacterium]